MAENVLAGSLPRAVAWVLIIGAVVFWIGAGTPPYKQWMGPPIEEYLTIIGTHRQSWTFINAPRAPLSRPRAREPSVISAARLATIERHRKRIWGLCYRMTGERPTADDLAQESLARAIERGEQAEESTFEGWLYRVATTTCLDWLRHQKVERAAVALVDPIEIDDTALTLEPNPEATLLRRDDMRLAIMSSLQMLVPRQRAVLILRDVLDLSTEDTASAFGLTAANVKVLLHRARERLADAHRVCECDVPVDGATVERFATALERGDSDGLLKLLADDVWGVVDDGLGRRKPNFGARAVGRQWVNAFTRYGHAEAIRRLRLNGEPALLVVMGGVPLATLHFETRAGRVVSTRVVLDPGRLHRLGIAN
jgi:RNA polymerase sigma-70 factor (ECF subfamily)